MKLKLAPVAKLAKTIIGSLSRPPRLLAFIAALAFLISLASWAFGDKLTSYALFFPKREGQGLGAEKRELPRRRGLEAKAELLASELLLGPLDPALQPAFPPGVRVSSLMIRKGKLYLDLSEDAALAERETIERGIAAIERSLALGLRAPRRFVVTIGGREAYAEAPEESLPAGGKKEQNN